jgi:hypothetical protein
MRTVIAAGLVLAFALLSASAQSPADKPASGETEEVLHKPDYGPGLKRGGATLRVRLRDSNGNKLQSAPGRILEAQLWHERAVHPVWYSLYARRFGAAESEFFFTGPMGAGLEAGTYDLSVWGSIFGTHSAQVKLDRDQAADVTVTLKGTPRIVKVKIVDQDGNPVARIPRQPVFRPDYDAPTRDYPTVDLAEYPHEWVLRNRPGYNPYGDDGGWPFESQRRSAFITDEGTVTVVTAAGIKGDIVIPLDDAVFGQPELLIPVPAEGADWDEKSVTVTVSARSYKHWAANSTPTNEADPGAKSLGNASPAPPVDWLDESTVPEGHRRLVVTLNNPRQGRFNVEVRTEPHFAAGSPVHSSGDVRVWHVPESALFDRVMVQHGTTAIAVHHFKEGEVKADQKVVALTVNADAPVLHLVARTPTAAAFGGCRIGDGGDVNRFARDPSQVVYRKFLGSVHYGLLIDGTMWDMRYEDLQGTERRARIKLNAEQRERLSKEKECDVAVSLPGLWFRVTAGDAPLQAYAEAVVHSLEEDTLARKMLEHESTLGDKRPGPATITGAMRNVALNTEATEKELAATLGAPLAGLYPDPEMQRRLARYGTWYNTERTLCSDEAGFVHGLGLNLEAGKRYVLYVWLHSRDDLKPDLRIVFEVQGMTTDLGLLPIKAKPVD